MPSPLILRVRLPVTIMGPAAVPTVGGRWRQLPGVFHRPPGQFTSCKESVDVGMEGWRDGGMDEMVSQVRFPVV